MRADRNFAIPNPESPPVDPVHPPYGLLCWTVGGPLRSRDGRGARWVDKGKSSIAAVVARKKMEDSQQDLEKEGLLDSCKGVVGG